MDDGVEPLPRASPEGGPLPKQPHRANRGEPGLIPQASGEDSEQAIEVWRPAASSFRNLAAFAAAICAAAATVLGLTHSATLTLVSLSLGFAVGVILTLMVSRGRVRASLEAPEHPLLANWPGTPEVRQTLERKGRVRMARGVAMALVVGALAGFYPVIGVAVVGAGAAGAVSGLVVTRMVRRFEIDRDVTVFSPSRRGGFRRPLQFGVTEGRP